MAKAIPGSWVNMVALGFAGALAGFPQEALEAAVRDDWKRGEAALAANLAALAAGYAAERGVSPPIEVPQVPLDGAGAKSRWSISGNEAAGFGAIRGGVRFVAAYPITPATEVLEWLAPSLAKVGGMLVQAVHHLKAIKQNPKNIVLHGQERNIGTWAICKMNMLLHGVRSADVRQGDTIKEPQHLDKDLNADGRLTDADNDGVPDAPVNPAPSNSALTVQRSSGSSRNPAPCPRPVMPACFIWRSS
jgi:hypothetical protein